MAISGWGIAAPSKDGQHTQKISKSKGGGPISPIAIFERYSADAARYWAASTGPGKDAVISEEKIQTGAKLVTKLWNVARFAERFIATSNTENTETHREMGDSQGGHEGHEGRGTSNAEDAETRREEGEKTRDPLRSSVSSMLDVAPLPADRWLLSRLQRLIARATAHLDDYDYAAAKSEVEAFFWTHLTDNYLELAKERLYGEAGPAREAARATLATTLLALLELFAPFLPYVTEQIYQALFAVSGEEAGFESIHRAAWPVADEALVDAAAERAGDALVALATAVRRYKSEAGLSLGAPLARLEIAADDPALAKALAESAADLRSVTRAREVAVVAALSPGLMPVAAGEGLSAALVRE